MVTEQTQLILIRDDHALLRAGLRALPTQDPGFEPVAEAGNGLDALRLAGEPALHPAPMGLSMPQMNGTQAVTYFK